MITDFLHSYYENAMNAFKIMHLKASLIQSTYRGYKIRKKLYYMKNLPIDLQINILIYTKKLSYLNKIQNYILLKIINYFGCFINNNIFKIKKLNRDDYFKLPQDNAHVLKFFEFKIKEQLYYDSNYRFSKNEKYFSNFIDIINYICNNHNLIINIKSPKIKWYLFIIDELIYILLYHFYLISRIVKYDSNKIKLLFRDFQFKIKNKIYPINL